MSFLIKNKNKNNKMKQNKKNQMRGQRLNLKLNAYLKYRSRLLTYISDK